VSITGMAEAGGIQSHDNMQPYVALNYCISLFGVFPSQT
jgi:microcystin-dependent protein